MPDTEATFRKVSVLVDQWLESHKGETFDLDVICRQLQIQERQNRHFVVQKLSYETKAGKLEKSNRIYRYIDNSIKYIDILNADENATVDIKWPYGKNDESRFGFDGHVVISPKDVIVVVGNSNAGKTTFVLNFLYEHMDTFKCRLMGNEYGPVKTKRRLNKMTWNTYWYDDNGTPKMKFDLIEKRKDWKDIIEPDAINIVDWINLTDKFYMVGDIIEGIQDKLRNGVALVVLQKTEEKTLGRGGTFSMDLAALYLSIDYERLTVLKAKEWVGINVNKKMYGFEITDGGSTFHNIREIRRCPACGGYGKKLGKECTYCLGKQYVDVF